MLADNIEHSIRDLLKINILSQIDTGNIIFDSVIKLFIMCFLTMFSSKIFIMLEKINFFNIKNFRHKLYFLIKRPKKIILIGSRFIELRYMSSRLDFSMRFNACLQKIVKSIELRPNNQKLVEKLRELQTRDKTRYSDNGDRNIEKAFNFIVDQESYFELDNDIYCNIYLSINEIENEKKALIQKEQYTIEIWSTHYNCSGLEKYIERITDEYEKYQSSINSEKKYIFKYDGSHTDRGIQWQITEFANKRTLDQVFFENKNEVMEFLERFIKERELYEKIGKPWQLGILLEGEPGCGKTSFIVGLSNYLNRSIKDCQFNRMKTIDDLEGCINCIKFDNKDMSIGNVIFVAEDFDCMTDIARSRKLEDQDMVDYKKNIDKKKAELKEQIDSMKSDEAKAIMFAIGKQDEEPVVVSTVKPETDTRKITLSNLLNIMDGISNMPGRIIIFSTNHSEKLDEAFLRPGRIDLRINFGRPTKQVIYQIILHWYKCIDEFYPEKNRATHFKKIWKNTYEKRILDKKYRPCDITNLLQKYGDNIEGVLNELV